MHAWRRLMLGVVGLLLVGCASGGPSGSSAAGSAAAPTGPAAPIAATAPAAAREPARLIVTSISLSAVPNYIARDLGFWAEEGIDPELILVPGAATPAQALVAGEVEFVGGAGATTVPSALEGAGVVVVAVMVNTFPNVISAPTIQRVEDLKGKRLGITRRGAATDFAARYTLPRFGLQPDSDVTIVPLNDSPGIMAGLAADAADAGMLTDFSIAQGRQLGYHELVNVGQLGVEYSQTGQVTTTALTSERPEYVRRFLRGWSRGLAYFLTNRAGAMPLALKYLDTSDSSLVEQAYDYVAPLIQRVPYPRPGGIQTVLDTLAPTNPRATSARPEQFMDDRFIRELDEGGFYKSLYGS